MKTQIVTAQLEQPANPSRFAARFNGIAALNHATLPTMQHSTPPIRNLPLATSNPQLDRQ